MSKYQVIGCYPFNYEGMFVTGHNCDFEYSKQTRKGIAVCLSKDDVQYTLSLTSSQGVCGSGWTTASWGHHNLVQKDTRESIVMVPKKGFEIVEFDETQDEIENKLFTVSYEGGDPYYPSGGMSLLESNWETISNVRSREG